MATQDDPLIMFKCYDRPHSYLALFANDGSSRPLLKDPESNQT